METRTILRGARQHLTDSLGCIVVATPLGALFENVMAGMSDEVSLKSRLIAGGLFLGGLGGVFGKGRDLSRKLLHITEETKEIYQQAHDMVYLAGMTAVVNPLIYIGAGARDPKEIAIATASATFVALCSGGLMGYSVDLFRDLTNYETSLRLPEKIRNAKSSIKQAAAVGIVAASIGAAGTIYALTPDKPKENTNIPQNKTTVLENYIKD